MNLKETFKKQGGIKLLKQYWQGGALFTGIGQFLLLGKSRTALEILRLSTTLKTKQKLEKKYNWKLEEFDKTYTEKEHKTSDIIWICWFQGMDNAPELVKNAINLLLRITRIKSDSTYRKNISDYVTFPEYIMTKWKQGVITHTHMTDLLRLELLINYGGLWLDATVLCTGDAPEYFLTLSCSSSRH